MKNFITLLLLGIPMTAVSSEYVTIISKQNNAYDSGPVVPVEPEPPEPLDLTGKAWRDVSAKDLSEFMPMAMDGSSSNQAAYKINVGQEPFKGNPSGFTPYDENYDISKLKNCNSETDGFCSAGNLLQVAYEHKNITGKYYFEIEAKGQAHSDCIGLSNVSTPSSPRASHLSVCYAGNYAYGSKWDQDNVYTEYRIGGLQTTGTVYQVWVDYDENRMAIMEVGTTLDDYINYDLVTEDASVLADIPWRHINNPVNVDSLRPVIYDGSSSGNSKYYFNFGQDPFLGDHTGFEPYDSNYNKDNWVGVYSFYDNDKYLQPHNTNRAYYDVNHNTGKYYFEVTSDFLTTSPYYDAIGFLELDSPAYYHVVGALITGSGMQGYHGGAGRGVYYKFKKSGIQPEGTTFQVFIDYDKGLVSVKTLGTTKDDYQDYYEVFEK